MRNRVGSLVAAMALGLLGLGATGEAKGPEVFPLSQVKPGQKGYGLTVFRGTTPERFEFEVIGVAKNMLPKVDIILVKSDDPKLAVSNFAAGMSGSPLYIDGKIACAFAYSWRFNKQSIGGCTPIEYMLDEARHARRGPDATALASSEEWKKYVPDTRTALAVRDSYLTRPALPLPAPPPAPAGDTGMVRAAVPLSISGMGPSAFEEAQRVFSPYHLEPQQGAGSGGDPTGGPRRFELGGNLAVTLAQGDMAINATCAVSYVDGSNVLACGHPMFGMGETYMPVTSAWIHVIIPSAQNAFKLSSPLRTIGSLVMDRQTAIVADTTKSTGLIPVDIRVKSGEGQKAFHVDVVRHRFLTPQIVLLAVASAAQNIAPDQTDAVLTLKSTVKIKGYDPLVFIDYMYSGEGLSPNVIAGARGLRVLVPLLFNPYEPVRMERVEVEAEIAYKPDYAQIESVRVPELELPYGKETFVDVVLRPYNGKEYVKRIPLLIPERLAGATVKIEVVPGDAARPDVAPPESLAQLMAALRKTYPANQMVATVYTPDEGVTLEGRILADLPDSALDTVRPSTTSRKTEGYRSVARAVVPVKQVVTGRQELVAKIADLK